MGWVGRIALALLSIALTLAVGEALVRSFGLGGTTRSRGVLHEYDAHAGWICARGADTRYEIPGSFNVRVRCNEHGLRELDDPPYAKPAGERRIAVLGDSFMWGFGVENEEMLSEALERELPNTQAISFAANGYSTIQQLVRFEAEALRYAPDWTVLFFCWNDLEDNFDDKGGGRPVARITASGELEIANSPVRERWKSPLVEWLKHHSRLFVLGDYGLELAKASWAEARSRAALQQRRADPRITGSGHPERISRLELYAPPGPKLDSAWRAVALALERLDRGARDAGGRLLVAWTPTPEAIRASTFAETFADPSGQALVGGLDWDRPARRLGRISAELGIPYLDPLPDFRAAPDPESLFLHANGHWSAAGHALAARRVAERIRSLEAADAAPGAAP